MNTVRDGHLVTAQSRILLHVGVQKTGSTYLQARMRAHAAELREQGVYVPVIARVAPMLGNAKLLATVLNGSAPIQFQHQFPDLDVAHADPAEIVRELLEGWQPEREIALLSAETLRPEHAARVRSLLPRFARVDVVLFVRRQDVWLDSYYRQLVKTYDARTDFAAFARALLDREDESLCRADWWFHRESWRTAFGNCHLVVFDEVRQDVFAALFAAADLRAPVGIPDVPAQQLALDLHQTAYLAALPDGLAYGEFARRRAASAEASRRLGAPQPRTLVDPATRSRLIERVSAANRRLFDALGRPSDAWDLTSELRAWTTLEATRSSADYARHKDVADEIFAS